MRIWLIISAMNGYFGKTCESCRYWQSYRVIGIGSVGKCQNLMTTNRKTATCRLYRKCRLSECVFRKLF